MDDCAWNLWIRAAKHRVAAVDHSPERSECALVCPGTVAKSPDQAMDVVDRGSVHVDKVCVWRLIQFLDGGGWDVNIAERYA